MASHKTRRAAGEIKRELANIMRELKDPRVSGMLSIVNLELTNDFSHCNIYISSLEGVEKTKEAVEGLTAASGFIKRELGHKVMMRKIPELHFLVDDGIEYSDNLGKLMKELNKKSTSDEELGD